MKKVLLSIVTLMFVFVMMPIVKAEEQVPVYMFSKDGCGACKTAQEYFEKLESEYPDLFELVEIQVFDKNWQVNSEALQELLIEVYENFDKDSSKASTPTIVIGDYITIGFPQDEDEVYDAIEAVQKSEKQVNVVQDLADKLEIDIEQEIENIQNNSTVQDDNTEGGKYDTIIIIGIFVVLIGGFAGLVVLGKK